VRDDGSERRVPDRHLQDPLERTFRGQPKARLLKKM
jgi:hypothetical protein